MLISRFIAAAVFVLSFEFAQAACSPANDLSLQILGLSAIVASVEPTSKCENGVQKTMTCNASNYGVGDGLNGNPVACAGLLPKNMAQFRHLSSLTQRTVALKVAKKHGDFRPSLCGKKVLVTYENEKTGETFTKEAVITDSGGLTRDRCIDLTRKLENDLHMHGTQKVRVQICK